MMDRLSMALDWLSERLDRAERGERLSALINRLARHLSAY